MECSECKRNREQGYTSYKCLTCLTMENKALKDALANMYGLFGTPLLRLKMGSAWTSMHSEACKIARSLIDW